MNPMFEKYKTARKTPQLIQGHRICPKAILMVKHYCDKAQSRGLILNETDYAVGAAGLIAAGMSTAAEQGTGRVRTVHIKTGWTKLRALECPPDLCIRTSIIQRVDELKESLPHFDDVLASISRRM
jgi:hypothetical protein